MAPMQALDPRRREDSQLSPRLSSNGFAIVVLCVLIIIAILPDSAAGGVRNIQSDTKSTWSRSAAANEIKQDIKSFLNQYSQKSAKLEGVLDSFIDSRQKEGGIRKLAKWGKAMGLLIKFLPDEVIQEFRGEIDEVAHKMATMLNSASLTSHSFVEDAVMRGWPMYRQPYCKHPVYEAYNFGHIGQAIAVAARTAADSGDYDKAVDLLKPLLGGLYDNFLTDDPRKTKLDLQGRLTLVPPQSPQDRFKRYREVNDYQICLEQPEMFNHGTSPARAAMDVMKVIDVIQENDGWKSVSWPLSECSLVECRRKLGEYVEKNGIWMKSALLEQPPSLTGQYPDLDKYPGDDGTPWYTWRYQDVSQCPDGPVYDPNGVRTAEFVDRPQDIQHGKEEMAFIHEYMVWDEQPNPFPTSPSPTPAPTSGPAVPPASSVCLDITKRKECMRTETCLWANYKYADGRKYQRCMSDNLSQAPECFSSRSFDSLPSISSGILNTESTPESTSVIFDTDSTPESTSGIFHLDITPESTSDNIFDMGSTTESTSDVIFTMDDSTRIGTSAVFNMEDIRRLIVTFLNRVVYDYSAASNNNLFACDVEGNITGYSCHQSRGIKKRSQGSANWLVLAYAAKKHGSAWDNANWDSQESRSMRCDVYRMVRTVLPLALTGSGRFDAYNFDDISSDWFAEIMMAKYFFYNYDYGIKDACT